MDAGPKNDWLCIDIVQLQVVITNCKSRIRMRVKFSLLLVHISLQAQRVLHFSALLLQESNLTHASEVRFPRACKQPMQCLVASLRFLQ